MNVKEKARLRELESMINDHPVLIDKQPGEPLTRDEIRVLLGRPIVFAEKMAITGCTEGRDHTRPKYLAHQVATSDLQAAREKIGDFLHAHSLPRERKARVADWKEIANLICQILTRIYVEKSPRLQERATANGITLEQLAAMSITQMINERMKKTENKDRIDA